MGPPTQYVERPFVGIESVTISRSKERFNIHFLTDYPTPHKQL